MNTAASTEPVAPADPKTDTRQPGMFVLPDGRNVATTFLLLVGLFAVWGFCAGLTDMVNQHFQNVFHFTRSQSAWVRTAQYLGYVIMAVPAGLLAARLGYKGGIVTGLLIVAAGGFWFIPASHLGSFWAFLLGVCIIVTGLVFLETIANPYAAVLGSTALGASRINLAQACNGVGQLCGPMASGILLHSRVAVGLSADRERLWTSYLALAVVMILLALVFYFADLPDVKAEDRYHADAVSPAALPLRLRIVALFKLYFGIWKRPHFVLAVVSQFLYFGAQAGVFSFFINYMISQTPAVSPGWQPEGHSDWFEQRGDVGAFINVRGAAALATLGVVCFLAGGFIGAGILKKVAAHTALGIFSALSAVFCLLVCCKLDWVSVASVFLIQFFMSIMYPTIFTLGLFGLGGRAKQASSFFVMATIGGVILPTLMGHLADRFDLARAFMVPLFCFAVIATYAFWWPRLAGAGGTRGLPASAGH